MFKKVVNSIERAEYWDSDLNLIYLSTADGLKAYSQESMEHIWTTRLRVDWLTLLSDTIWVQNEDILKIIKTNNGNLLGEINAVYFKTIISNDAVLVNDRRDGERKLSLLKVGSLDLLWTNELYVGKFIYGNSNGFFLTHLNLKQRRLRNSILYYINKNNGRVIFELNIAEIGSYFDEEGHKRNGEIKKFLGVYNGIFWVAITNHKLLGIDVETGEIIHELRDIPDFECAWLPSAIPDPHGMQLDEKHGRIIGFRWEFYWEIDLNQEKPEIELYNLSDYFRELGVRSTLADYVLTNDYLYFSEFESGKIGAFNRQTKRVDWLHHLEHIKDDSLNLIISKLDYDNNRLYVLDSEGTLHIFERE